MDVEIARSIEENLTPWPNAWKDLQPGEYLRPKAYDNLLPHYNTAVWQYAVSLVALCFGNTGSPFCRHTQCGNGSSHSHLCTLLCMV